MRNIFLNHRLFLTGITLSLAACGGGGGSGDGGSSTGSLDVSVTDAPVDTAEKVLVQFTGVTVKPKEGEADYIPLSGPSQTCQQYLDKEPPIEPELDEPTIRCIDLKKLQGTDTENLLSGVLLEAGNYNWMRLDIDAERDTLDSIIEIKSGEVYSLYVPSGSESGLKLNTGFTILAGGSHDFVIDFDLRKSINDPQGFEDYRLKPTLRMIDLAESGNIYGVIDASYLTADGCTGDINTGDGFAVYVYEGGEGAVIDEEGSDNAPLTSSSISWNTDENQWEYSVGFLSPGDYTIAFTCQATEDGAEVSNDGTVLTESPQSPTNVVADQDSEVNFPAI